MARGMAGATRYTFTAACALVVVGIAVGGEYEDEHGASSRPAALTCVASLLGPDGQRIFVWEDLHRRDGAISFFRADNVTLLANLTKRDVDAGQEHATTDGSNATCCGLGFSLAQLTAAGPDLMGIRLLAGGGDPDEAAVAAALPKFIGGVNQIAAFVGSRLGPAYPLTRSGTPAISVGFTHPWGWPGGPLAGPQVGGQTFGADRLVCANPATAGVVGGYLPVLRWSFDETGTACGAGPQACCRGENVTVWDITVLGEPDAPSAAHQTVWWRYLRYNMTTGEVLDTVIVDSNQAYPSTVYDSYELRVSFYTELLKTSASYNTLFGAAASEDPSTSFAVDLAVDAPSFAAAGVSDHQAMIVQASDLDAQRIIDQAKHSIIREWIVRPDIVWNRYGVPPDQYGGSESDGFQENVNSGATAAISWGFLGTARAILSTYWQYMVRNDGGIKYRGAMLPGYGRMLTVLAQYIATADDASILTQEPIVAQHVEAVLGMLTKKIAAAKRLPTSHIAHGLPLGCDEADACYMYSTFTGTLGELPYYSASMEVWRGLRDLGRVFQTCSGFDNNRTDTGKALTALAATLSADISASWSRSVEAAGCPPYVAGAGINRTLAMSPPYAPCTHVEGLVAEYHQVGGPGLPPTRPANSFARVSEPWRAYAEMFHSGWLSDNDTALIYSYQQNHDSLMRLGVAGGVNVNNAMFGHTAYGTAYGLIASSMAEEFLLFLYTQTHHGATAGTWTAWEKTLLDRSKSVCCFAAPAQLTVPSSLRWALVFEDEAKGLVALARTLPRAWFLQPNASLTVVRAPVSRQLLTEGSIGYSLLRDGPVHRVFASVNITGRAGKDLQSLSIRLRLPVDWGNVTSVVSGSGDDWLDRLDGDVLQLCDAGSLPSSIALQRIRIDYSQPQEAGVLRRRLKSDDHHTDGGIKGNLTLPLALDSNMVLQRAPKSARLWGWTSPTEVVTIVLKMPNQRSISTATTATSAGRWETTLPPLPAGVDGSLLFTTPSGGHRLLTNIAVGDVYMCSGQSHMQFPVNLDLEGPEAIASSANYPGIRMMTVRPEPADVPRDDLASVFCTPGGHGRLQFGCNTSWLVSEPASFGQAQAFTFPSAICFFFARSLYTSSMLLPSERAPVPIGIISAAVGGTEITLWMSDEARADNTCGGVNVSTACQPSIDDSPPPRLDTGNPTPGCFFNGMIAPLAPMTLRGILWDQGTSDASDSCISWSCKLSSLAHDWRVNTFADESLLFTIDQLRAADRGGGGIEVPGLSRLIPHSTYATRVDLSTCMPNSTFDGHARRKAEVGRRLALAAMVVELGQAPTPWSFGPSIDSVAAVASSDGRLLNISVQLNHATTLHFSDAPECDGCCNGRTGEHILGVPTTGDSWSVGFDNNSGAAVLVCKDKSLGCDGAAHLRAGGSVDWLIEMPTDIKASIRWVAYGGSVPFLAQADGGGDASLMSPLGCSGRFGIGACGIYNGEGGFDDHSGVPMAAQIFRVHNGTSVKTDDAALLMPNFSASTASVAVVLSNQKLPVDQSGTPIITGESQVVWSPNDHTTPYRLKADNDAPPSPVRLVLPKLVSSHMVLQAERPSLHGWTSGDRYVTVLAQFKNATGHTVAVSSHPTKSSTIRTTNATAWTVDLPPQSTSLTPVDILLTMAGGARSTTLSDVLFGDVFVCSGQSNMEFSIAAAFDATFVIAASSMPGLRLAAVQKNGSGTRLPDIKQSQYGPRGWVVASPATVCGAEYGAAADYCEPHCAYSPDPKFKRPTWGYFSAVCLIHGMHLLNATGRPQGLIESAWGGSEIELWSSAESRAQCPSTWCPGQPVRGRCAKDGLYFAGMIAPLVHVPIRGVLWFQGEANSAPTIRAHQYKCQLTALIGDWRSRWYRSENFSFGVVQLAPAGDSSGGFLRWAQREVVLTVPGSYLTNTIDLYDAHSPCGAVHIRNKTAVGHRLALGTMTTMASRNPSGAIASGPVPTNRFTWPILQFAAGTSELPLGFRVVNGMTIVGTSHCNFEITTIGRPLNVTAAWGGWKPVESVSIAGSGLMLRASRSRLEDASSPSTVLEIVVVRGVRYAWGDVPSTDSATAMLNGQFLYDATGLPLGMFIAECSADRSCQVLAGQVNPMPLKLYDGAVPYASPGPAYSSFGSNAA